MVYYWIWWMLYQCSIYPALTWCFLTGIEQNLENLNFIELFLYIYFFEGPKYKKNPLTSLFWKNFNDFYFPAVQNVAFWTCATAYASFGICNLLTNSVTCNFVWKSKRKKKATIPNEALAFHIVIFGDLPFGYIHFKINKGRLKKEKRETSRFMRDEELQSCFKGTISSSTFLIQFD